MAEAPVQLAMESRRSNAPVKFLNPREQGIIEIAGAVKTKQQEEEKVD